jgi:hypothetical protein
MSYSFEDVVKQTKLRYRMVRILRTQACFRIRFRMLNVGIDSYMWPGLATAIENGTWCNVFIGDGNDCDPANKSFYFSSENPRRFEIVHEATHMLIWATHVGAIITTGVHEAAAYLAECLFTLYFGDKEDLSTQPHLAPPLFELATFVKDHTRDGKPSVVCNPASVNNIIAILSSNKSTQDMNQGIRQTGIGEWWKS